MSKTETICSPIAVSELAISKATGLSLSFLQHDRISDRRIPYFRIGRRVLYSPARVQQALAAMEEGGTTLRKRR